MNNFLFVGDSFTPLAQSLKRYFRYLFKVELGMLDGYIPSEADKIDLVYVINEPWELDKCFTWIHKNNLNPDRLRILGYDSNADINLLEVETLKIQIENNFHFTRGIARSNIPFISNRVKLFFKGHGEQSLLGCIGWVNYYLCNYPTMADSGQYSPIGLNETFLLPGIQNWNEFTRRFCKYAPILYASGWDNHVSTIERHMKVINMDIKRIGLSDSFYTFDSQSMISLSEITSVIEEMALQAEQTYGKTNTPDYR